jgi:hypothetical protein
MERPGQAQFNLSESQPDGAVRLEFDVSTPRFMGRAIHSWQPR